MPVPVRAAPWRAACAAALAVCALLAAQTVQTAQIAQACSQVTVTNHWALIGSLRAAGAKVVQEQRLRQPFFDVDARLLMVDGEGVQVFEYGNATLAAKQAARVSSDGSQVGTSKPLWVEPPHFYRKGRLLVLYLGEDAKLRERLACLLGPAFAER